MRLISAWGNVTSYLRRRRCRPLKHFVITGNCADAHRRFSDRYWFIGLPWLHLCFGIASLRILDCKMSMPIWYARFSLFLRNYFDTKTSPFTAFAYCFIILTLIWVATYHASRRVKCGSRLYGQTVITSAVLQCHYHLHTARFTTRPMVMWRWWFATCYRVAIIWFCRRRQWARPYALCSHSRLFW